MRKAICLSVLGVISIGWFAGRAGSQGQPASGFDRLKTLETHPQTPFSIHGKFA